MKAQLLLIGGGGHCRACIDVIEAEGKYKIEGVIDSPDKLESQVLDYTIIGSDNNIDEYIKKGFYFLITIGQIKSAQKRKSLYQLLKSKNARLATIVAPSATVSRYARIGEGSIVMHGAILNAGAVVGDNVILNTNSLIEHDAVVGNHVHISTHSIVNGAAKVEEGSFIGSNAVVSQAVRIGKEVVVGAGSVIIGDILTSGIYVGNPAKKVEK